MEYWHQQCPAGHHVYTYIRCTCGAAGWPTKLITPCRVTSTIAGVSYGRTRTCVCALARALTAVFRTCT